jgi:hypothetical protein
MAPRNAPGGGDTFDASAYGTLRYDFKKFGGVQGMIPDPSDEMIENYMRALRDIAREFGEDEVSEDATPEEIQDALDNSNLEIKAAQDAMALATSELCQASPSADELLRLPFRVRVGFFNWLQRKLMDPEASASGTSPVRAIRPGG